MSTVVSCTLALSILSSAGCVDRRLGARCAASSRFEFARAEDGRSSFLHCMRLGMSVHARGDTCEEGRSATVCSADGA